MSTEHCDVLIVGGGPGGISAASKVVLPGDALQYEEGEELTIAQAVSDKAP